MESVSLTTGGDGAAIMVLVPSLIEPQPLTQYLVWTCSVPFLEGL